MSEEDRSQRVRKSLAEAHLVEIAVEEFPDRIRDIKQVAISHLSELLQNETGLQEPRSVAHALGTLSRLEATLRGETVSGMSNASDPSSTSNSIPRE